MSQDQYRHHFPMQVRWGDCDLMGHVNNVQFVRFVESGRVAYCEEVMDLPLTSGMKVGWILADIQCSYLSQVHYPDRLQVCTRVSRIGHKSITLDAEIYRQDSTEPVLASKAVMVWYDYKKQRSASIPDEIRQKIQAFDKAT